jgi:hypothetical protein
LISGGERAVDRTHEGIGKLEVGKTRIEVESEGVRDFEGHMSRPGDGFGRIGNAGAAKMHSVMDVWQGTAMDSLKFHPSPPCPTLYALQGVRPAVSSTPLDNPGLTPMIPFTYRVV